MWKILLLIAVFQISWTGQKIELEKTAKSPLIKIKGKALSSDTLYPITSTITITYETLPNGNDFGILFLKNGAAEFHFPLRRDCDYRVQAKAPGFTAASRTLGDLETSQEELAIEFLLKPAKKGDLLELRRLVFDQGKSQLKPLSFSELDDLIATLNINPHMVVQLEGHTDIRGNEKLNMGLSKDRVEEVKRYLTQRGIPDSRIKTKAFGEERPLVSRGAEEARRINRRVEVRILDM